MGKHPHGFGSKSTAFEIIDKYGDDFKGNVLITGANSGIGFENARTFLLCKDIQHIIIGCRTKEKVLKTKEELKKVLENDKELKENKKYDVEEIVKKVDEVVIGHPLELNDLDSVRAFVKWFYEQNIPLNILINNAGIMMVPQNLSKQGWELQWGVNYMGHWLLTQLLLKKLIQSAPSRIVCLSSIGHKWFGGQIDYDNLKNEKTYNKNKAYGRSKIGNLHHAKKLHQVLEEHKVDVKALSVHPGGINTNLGRHVSMPKFLLFLGKPFMKTIPQGSATTSYAALHPEAKSGEYCADCWSDTNKWGSKWAKNQEETDKLWAWTCKEFGYKEDLSDIFEEIEKEKE